MSPDRCAMCERLTGEGNHFIADLAVSRAYLNPDQYFPGWVFVVLRRHAEELYELAPAERSALIEDVTDAARALAGDPDPQWPVWRVPHDPAPLAPDLVRDRVEAIRRALGRSR